MIPASPENGQVVPARLPVATPALRRGPWEHVTTRSYGTTVYHVPGRPGFYVKATPRHFDDPKLYPEVEAERLCWLARTGLPVPEVVEVGGDDVYRWLVTTAIPGRPAGALWPAPDRERVVDVVAETARAMHTIDPRECPFTRDLAVTLGEARTAARRGVIDLDDLDPPHLGWTAADLLEKLDNAPPPAEDDVVVCHGDLCLSNVLIDPASLTLAGVIDAGKLGTSDRWLDLAVLLPDLDGGHDWGYGPRHTERFLRGYGLSRVDRRKLDYYRLLDEFM